MNRDTAILQLMHARGLGARTLTHILKRLDSEQYPVEEFVSAPISELTHVYDLKPNIAESVKLMQDEADRLAEELYDNDIQIIVMKTAKYPKRLSLILGDTAPPVIFARGDLTILEQKSTAICGSREATEEGCRMATDCAASLAEHGINTVSGYASGIDSAAHYGALSAGGVTTIIPATGILHFQVKPMIADLLSADNHIVISEFIPRSGWLAHNAMLRNRTICAMSHAIILIEPRLSGGTFAAGKTALELRRQLFLADYADSDISPEGNTYFLKRNAKPLQTKKDGKPDLNGVFQVVENTEDLPPQTSFVERLDSGDCGNDTIT